jgi:hypothetical protein
VFLFLELAEGLALFGKIITGRCLSNVDQDRKAAGLGNRSRSPSLQEA